ncbi:MAG: hypothetical protein Tsb002_25870 [Wenzhouxiangellaceae bacterium]
MPTIKQRRLGFRQGWPWLRQAADTIARQPLAFIAPAGWLLLIGSLQWLVPGIGPLLAGLLAPLSMAPLLATFADSHAGAPANGYANIQAMLSTQRLLPLLRLGLYLMLVLILVSQLTGLAMAQLLPAELIKALEQRNTATLLNIPKDDLILLLVMTALPIGVLGVLAWFSIPLVVFKQMPVPRVIWRSLRAVARNWQALLALTLSLILVSLGGLLLLTLLSALIGAFSSTAAIILNLSLGFIAALFLQACLAGAQYLSCQQAFPSPPDCDDHCPAPTQQWLA